MRKEIVIGVGLALAAVIVYRPLAHAGFVNFDDPGYVAGNWQVQRGLTTDGLVWAFTSTVESNWHPLVWLSHMLDCQLFGVDPGWHHLVNLALHVGNALLVFWVLKRMTAALWPAAFVAALFAVHPLHVESVAWIAERKDVLSTFLGLAALLAYARYAARPSLARYVPVYVLLALGLMAKPMLVTLPLVMLLLDYWPLGRMALAQEPIEGWHARGIRSAGMPHGGRDDHAHATAAWACHPAISPRAFLRLVLEKVPLVALSLAAGLVTLIVQEQGGATELTHRYDFSTRLSNALVAYVTYLYKMICPTGLAVFYPYVPHRPAWQTLGAAAILVAVTGLVVWQARRRPYLAVGWFWYMVMLVPVIGLVQVGGQAMADRYTYVPLVGVFVAVAWGAADIVSGWPRPTRAIVPAALAAVVIAGAMYAATRQVRFWSDSETLFRHAIEVTARNALAHNNLGLTLYDESRFEEARAEYEKAVAINPAFVGASANLGLALFKLGRLDEAIECYRNCLRLNPRYAPAHVNLGVALAKQGHPDEAIVQYHQALRLKPDSPDAHNHLGTALMLQGKTAEAIAEYEKALVANPWYASAHDNLAFALAKEGRPDDAIRHMEEAVRINPGNAVLHHNLAAALLPQGREDEAIAHYREALRINPDYVSARLNLAIVFEKRGNLAETRYQLLEVLRVEPDMSTALHQLAWISATAPQAELRDGRQAVALAERLRTVAGRKDPEVLDVLAAAYAEVGRFTEAVATAREAAALARSLGRNDQSDDIEKRLNLYGAGRPYRQIR